MDEILNIVMFGHKHIPSREGGVEIVVEELATRMADKGHDVVCINRRGHHVSGSEFDCSNMSEYKGVKLQSVPTIEKKGLAAFSSSFFAALKAAVGKYEIVHIHAEGPAAFCWLPKITGKKVIVTCHGLDWDRPKWKNSVGGKFIKYGERAAVKHADKIIVLSSGIRNYFKNQYGLDAVYIPNGVNRPHYEEADLIKKKWGLDKDSYILSLSRLTEEKNIDLLIEAYKEIKTDKLLVIAGGSSDSDEYVAKLHNMAMNDPRIIFTGFVQGKVIEELYSNAYIYCLPSKLEGMPLSLLEAMSYGNCCLVSDIDECSEVVEDKAEKFENNNLSELKERLVALLNNNDKVFGYKMDAADYICGKYSWDDVVNKTIDLYLGKI